ncbi:MAG: DUF484 family protein [Burkholderiaceae bacterium]|jgi:uncharacterized protein YigA (DUF484 family)|nr:DUF484 family protein [Burkholderiaceae bacterium]
MTQTPPFTEDDLARFLRDTPGFFERQAELLATVRLTSPHGGRAVSLQERQAEMLRDRIKLIEQRLMEMMRHGNENMLIADKVQIWARQMFLVRHPVDLPAALLAGLQAQFSVPQVAIKVWGVAEIYADQPFACDVSQDARTLANSLMIPYCGVNSGFDVLDWLDEPERVQSLALLPLRPAPQEPAFGLLVLASPDSQRYQAGMATDFLERIGELASAALSRVRDDAH